MVVYIKYIFKKTDSSLNISLIIFSCLVTYLVPQIKYIKGKIKHKNQDQVAANEIEARTG